MCYKHQILVYDLFIKNELFFLVTINLLTLSLRLFSQYLMFLTYL